MGRANFIDIRVAFKETDRVSLLYFWTYGQLRVKSLQVCMP